jgi:hypothetical protein
MLRTIRHFRQLWHYLGPAWLAYRLSYAVRLRTGLMQCQLPATDWNAHRLNSFLNNPDLIEPESYLNYRRNKAPSFFFSASDRQQYRPFFANWDGESITSLVLCDSLGKGILRYFERISAQVGFPPDWHTNPFTGQQVPADRHWSRINDFSYGDIKVIWEISRFGFVYDLVRAYWRVEDERYAELFWQLIEDWCANNPPQKGPNWKMRARDWLQGYGLVFWALWLSE